MADGSGRRVMVLGVPDSAGAYCVGVEHAPAALRAAGLVDRVAAAGGEVHDAGDLTVRRWRPDRVEPRVQNVGEEVDALLELAASASTLLEQGSRLLVLGGSCLVAVGVCAGIARLGERPRLVYVDRHLDLNTPLSTEEGSLSWMGMAHALRLPGSDDRLTDALGDQPLLTSTDLVYLGAEIEQTTSWERDRLQELAIGLVGQDDLVADPEAAARRALGLLPEGPFAVHVDVDVLDFIDAPLAENVNGRNRGPTVEQLGSALGVLLAHPSCWGLSVGQLDPAHAASDFVALRRFTAAVAAAVTALRHDHS